MAGTLGVDTVSTEGLSHDILTIMGEMGSDFESADNFIDSDDDDDNGALIHPSASSKEKRATVNLATVRQATRDRDDHAAFPTNTQLRRPVASADGIETLKHLETASQEIDLDDLFSALDDDEESEEHGLAIPDAPSAHDDDNDDKKNDSKDEQPPPERRRSVSKSKSHSSSEFLDAPAEFGNSDDDDDDGVELASQKKDESPEKKGDTGSKMNADYQRKKMTLTVENVPSPALATKVSSVRDLGLNVYKNIGELNRLTKEQSDGGGDGGDGKDIESKTMDALHDDLSTDEYSAARHSAGSQDLRSSQAKFDDTSKLLIKLPVLEDWLHKKSAKTFGGWQKRWFVVKRTHFLWAKTVQKIDDPLSIRQRRKFQNSITLLQVSKIEAVDDDKENRRFRVATPAKSYLFRASDQAQRDKWVDGLKQHLGALQSSLEFLNQKVLFKQQTLKNVHT